jgi:hypothetical protein
MKLKFLSLLILTLSVAAVQGCKKEGCDDPAALNYNEKANENNGTCVYELSSVLWFGDTTSVHLSNDGITQLSYYVDSNLIGVNYPESYWSSQPACGQAITFRENTSETAKTHSYYVHNQFGVDVWTGTFTSTAGFCNSIQLDY